MKTGRVKWFNAERGYGFIFSDEGDVFVHYSAIEFDGVCGADEYVMLLDGQVVEYERQRGPKGLYATRVVAREEAA